MSKLGAAITALRAALSGGISAEKCVEVASILLRVDDDGDDDVRKCTSPGDVDVLLGRDESATHGHLVAHTGAETFTALLGFETAQHARAAFESAAGADAFGSMASIGVDVMKSLIGGDADQVSNAIAKVLPRFGLDNADNPVAKDIWVPILKKDEEQRTILGTVLQPDVVDAQGDTIDADEIRKTAHEYLIHFRNLSIQHQAYRNDILKLVESHITETDQVIAGTQVRKGTWVIRVRVDDDDVWKAVKDGDFTGFSIAGFAKREPIETAAA